MSCREVGHHPLSDCHKIAPVGNIIRGQVNSHARGFEWASRGIAGAWVVTEDPEVGDIAPCFVPFRDCPEPPHHSFPGDPVHVRGPGEFKRRPPPEFCQRFIRHSIAKNYNIFHAIASNWIMIILCRYPFNHHIMARTASCTLSADPRFGDQPSCLIRSMASCIFGTSPAHPRIPPV